MQYSLSLFSLVTDDTTPSRENTDRTPVVRRCTIVGRDMVLDGGLEDCLVPGRLSFTCSTEKLHVFFD